MECFFRKIKWFRRIATRYDKSDASFLAFVYLASIAILLLYLFQTSHSLSESLFSAAVWAV